jgi:hypothetical protein
MRRLTRLLLPVLFVAGLLAASESQAGTQDFTLVNQTGGIIYSLFMSESTNNSWEEDMLGDKTLAQGARLPVTFNGRTACLWDMKVTDPDGNEAFWTGINLCQVSVVVLRCNNTECWAEYE